MSRCGCPEEDEQQTLTSPGIVVLEETIVFAIIHPRTADENGIATLPNSDLSARKLSVCRGNYSSYPEFYEKVVRPQLSKDPTRKYLGYHFALCGEIRAIEAELRSENIKVSVGKANKSDEILKKWVLFA